MVVVVIMVAIIVTVVVVIVAIVAVVEDGLHKKILSENTLKKQVF